MAKRIELSVIIPTLNRSEILGKSLELLERQLSGINSEVWIIDNGSSETERQKNRKICKQWKNIHLSQFLKSGPAGARNWALDKVSGEILLFLNDDSWVERGFVEKHLDFHKKNKGIDAALVGLTDNHPETVKSETMKWLIGQSGLHFNYRFKKENKVKRIPWYYFWTCNCSIKLKFVIKNQLKFDESFPTAAWEDIEFAYRAKLAGLKLFFDGQARTWHYHQLNFKEIKNRFISHGRGLWHLKNKLPKEFLPLLIKSSWGKGVLWLMSRQSGQWWEKQLEKVVERWGYFNIIMQWLVIRWKAEGYYAEERKMSSL